MMTSQVKQIDESVIVSVKESQVSSDLDGESVILDLDQGIYYGMNEIGSRVWQLIQKPVTVNEVIAAIQNEYEVERDRCKQDIVTFLRQLEEQNLLNITESDE